MSRVYVKLFNTPYVLVDDKKVKFPFMKAEALFYYLAVNKQATRDELVNLFWSENGEKTAKKNLRNAMYKIRKAFDTDIIISPQKSIVMINPEIEVKTDLELFMSKEEERTKIYDGEFLKGYFVKNADKFEEWLFNKREYFKGIYISWLYEEIENMINRYDFTKAEQYGKILIKEDEFDERAYRILMTIYKKQGAYNKAIELYNKLTGILDKELGITPDMETDCVIKEIINLKNSHDMVTTSRPNDFFYGRETEISVLRENFNLFKTGNKYMSILIMGEAGIGKTKLKEKFYDIVKDEDVFILQTNCYQVEQKYFFKPWNTIFSQLSNIIEDTGINIPHVWKKIISYLFPEFAEGNFHDNNPIEQLDTLKFHVIEEAILGVFKKLSERRKIIVFIEDIQWIDSMSLSLLSSIMLRNNNIMFIGTCRNSFDKVIDKFITTMKSNDIINVLKIQRFTKSEVEDFINDYIPNNTINEAQRERIYRETEGNTFFLVEYLNMIKEKGIIDNSMSSKMQDILKTRFLDISDEGKKLLNIASMFFDKISLNLIKILSAKEELEIIDIMEELQNKNIIREISGDEISFQFTHQKLRDFVYLQLSSSKKRILHGKIAQILEDSLKKDKSDMSIYTKLIYHFSNAENHLAALKYSIKYLDTYLHFKHELFPILKDININNKNYLYISKEEVLQYFNNIEELLEKVRKKHVLNDEIIKLQAAFLHMKGRYLIREGEYEEGIKYIERMIKDSLSIKSYNMALKGYRQMIYYGIQIHNINLMKENVDTALEIAYEKNLLEEVGILLRLKGLNRLMSGNYDEAEELLKSSIAVFNKINSNNKEYSLNIAACYNYMGEIRRHNMRFYDALEFYDKAMKICEEQNVLRGLNIFSTNAGQAAFEMGDYIRSREYLEKALKINEQLDYLWGRSTAEGYMALLMIKEGQYKCALKHLKNADKYARKLKSPYEIGIVYRVKAEIKANMQNNRELNKVFSDYLNHELKEYCKRGIELLRKVKESYEIEILNALNK